MPASKRITSFVDLDQPLPSGPSRRGHRRAQREKRAAAASAAAPPAVDRNSGILKGYRVIASGMPRTITEGQVRSILGSAGRILHCQLGRDKRTKELVGAAEVVFETQAQAEKAARTMNGVTIDGYVISVQARGLAFYTNPGASKSGEPKKKDKPKKPASKSAPAGKGKKSVPLESELDSELARYMRQ